MRKDAGSFPEQLVIEFNLYLTSSQVHKTGGTDSYIKKENLKRTPRRYQAPAYAWWAWLDTLSPLRATNSKTTYYLLSFFFFHLKTLKGIVKAPIADLSS